jgi:hypothetical protein
MTVHRAVLDYLATGDAMCRAELKADDPSLEERLSSADEQRAVLAWLGTAEAEGADDVLLANALSFARAAATPDDAELVRRYTVDEDARVRLAAYEVLLTAYFPDVNRPALMLVLQAMLADEAEQIRTLGASYVERAGAGAELAPYLRRWAGRQTTGTAASEIVARLLETGGE